MVRDFVVALFVAGLLAASVDAFFKTEFARDVFNAAFSYVLPDELKQEIRRIIEYKFLCVKHHMILKLIPIEDDLFKSEVSVGRTIKNISRYNQDVKNSFALDEWGLTVKSAIENCTMIFGEKEYASKTRSDVKGGDAIGMETEAVTVQHNDQVVLVSKGYEIKTGNSEFMINFTLSDGEPRSRDTSAQWIRALVWFWAAAN